MRTSYVHTFGDNFSYLRIWHRLRQIENHGGSRAREQKKRKTAKKRNETKRDVARRGRGAEKEKEESA